MNFRSTKIITIVAALVLAGGLVYFVFDLKPSGIGSITFEQQLEENVADTFKDIDSDNDGLKDWEEGLWGTDPLNSDTDGDGKNDGAEVELKRNPTVAGPDDALDLVFSEGDPVSSGEDAEPYTFTKTVSRNLFEKYLLLKQQNQFDDVAQQELIQDIVSSASLSVVEKRVYTTSDLNIINDNSQEALIAYGDALRGAFVQNSTTEVGKELVIIQNAISEGKQDKEELSRIRIASQSYEAIEKASLGINTPFDVSVLHTKLVNSYAAMSAINLELAEMFDDPMRALIGLREYNSEIEILTESITNIRFFLESRGIIFDESTQRYIIKS